MSESERSPDDLKQRAIQGVIWSALESWGGQAAQLLSFLVLARLLLPESFGLVSLSNIFIHFVQALIGSGFSDAIVQRKELEPEHLDTAFWINLGIGALLTGLGVLAAPAISHFFKEPGLVPIVRVLSFNVLLNSLAGIQEATLRRQLAFKSLAARRVVGLFAGSITGVTLAFLGFGVWSLVAQSLVGSLTDVTLLWKVSTWRPRFRISWKHFRELFAFGINVVGIGVLIFFSRRGDDLLIGYFLGAEVLGYYTVAYKLLISVMQLLTETVRKVALPTLARLQNDMERLHKAIYLAAGVMSLVAFPSFVGLSVLSPEIIVHVFGKQWMPSIPVMQVLAFVGIIFSASFFSGPVITAMGKPSWNLAFMITSTLVRFAGFAIAAQHGIVAVAWALLICSYAVEPMRVFMLRRVSKINLITYFKQYIPAVVGTIVMAASLILIKMLVLTRLSSSVFLLAFYIFCGIVIYSTFIILLYPRDLARVLDIIPVSASRKISKWILRVRTGSTVT